METRRLRSREANVEFTAASSKSRESCRKQQTLQVVTNRNVIASERACLWTTVWSTRLSSLASEFYKKIQ